MICCDQVNSKQNHNLNIQHNKLSWGSLIFENHIFNVLGSKNPCVKESPFSFDKNYELYHQKNAQLHKHHYLNAISGRPLTLNSCPRGSSFYSPWITVSITGLVHSEKVESLCIPVWLKVRKERIHMYLCPHRLITSILFQ